MLRAQRIAHLRGQQIDYDETERLKAKLAKLQRRRQPFYLTSSEFEEILKWKLGRQINRQRERRSANTDETIRKVTGLALTITHPDQDYELELRTGILCTLRGVAVPVASAILALVFPEKYAVIDYRLWRQLFGQLKYVFSVADYKRYMRAMHPLARELNWPVQEVDHAIWEYDRRGAKGRWP
ncbi:MAG: hypothetical protein JSW03_11605 [Candidatus Eiseniibacteriota bacterium]|nr:MAG: hypothetical protein JSW03_11605 [Candidatus Eisenbacteria bacterium]